MYANLNNLLGFEIADARTGKIIKRVEAPAEMWKAKWADPNLQFLAVMARPTAWRYALKHPTRKRDLGA